MVNYNLGIVKKGENVPETVRDTRIGELRRYSKRILIQADEYVENCKQVVNHFQKINDFLKNHEEYNVITEKISEIINQYTQTTNTVYNKYENLAVNISEYVDKTLDNLRTALEKITKLDNQIERCEAELDRYGKN